MFPSFEGTLCSFHDGVKTKFRRFALGFIFINRLQGSIKVIILQVAVELFENRMPFFLVFLFSLLCGEFLKKNAWNNRPLTSSTFCLCFKTSPRSKPFLWKWNEFDLHGNEPVGETHFHMNSFAQRLVLKQRQKATRKWPIILFTTTFYNAFFLHMFWPFWVNIGYV